MGSQYNNIGLMVQGQAVNYTSTREHGKNRLPIGGIPMTPGLSTGSEASSAGSSIFSSGMWNYSQPLTPCNPEDTMNWQTSFNDMSLDMQNTDSNDFTNHKPTFKSLGWAGMDLFKLYSFIVPKGESPYFELLPGGTATAQTPQMIFLDEPAYSQKGTFPCCYPMGCKKNEEDPFTRPADLERHYKIVHCDVDQRESFYCDYGNGKCDRHDAPFTRKDHYRDHLKDYHKEDIGCATRRKKMTAKEYAQEQKTWEMGRKIYAKHWRCVGCLVKNVVAEVGWVCSMCKKGCEKERQEAREILAQKSLGKQGKHEHGGYAYESPIKPEYSTCSTCINYGYPGYIDNGMGAWIDCPECVGPWSSGSASGNY